MPDHPTAGWAPLGPPEPASPPPAAADTSATPPMSGGLLGLAGQPASSPPASPPAAAAGTSPGTNTGTSVGSAPGGGFVALAAAARPDLPDRDGPAVRGRLASRAVPAAGAFLAVVATAAACTAIAVAAPVLGHGWQVSAVTAVPAVVAVVAGAAGLWLSGREGWPTRPVAAAAIAVVTVFTIGAASTVVVDGRVLPATSPAAQVLVWSRGYVDDLRTVFAVDELLELDDTAARARRGEYAPAVTRMRQVSAAWADVDDAPDDRLVDLAHRLATAAHFAAEALVRREQLLTSPDSVLADQVAANRTAFITEAVPLGPALDVVGDSYGIDVTEGPTE